jgi:hypothetical protein
LSIFDMSKITQVDIFLLFFSKEKSYKFNVAKCYILGDFWRTLGDHPGRNKVSAKVCPHT